MSMVTKIMSAVAKAKATIGDLNISVTVTKRANSLYDPSTLAPTQVVTTASVDGFVSDWEIGEVDGTIVRSDDIKFYVFPTDFVLEKNDQVELNGNMYSVVRVVPTIAGNRIALTMLQLRK